MSTVWLLYSCAQVVVHALIDNVPEAGFRRAVEALRLGKRIGPDTQQPDWRDDTTIFHQSGVIESIDRDWIGTRDDVALVGEKDPPPL